ncbi:aspartyl-phosphate phosphatase Spo0E family protein [Clostridiisalibacter paucivorans]|uniref:aspartyl-phosphate phosphatase Spo0E family protein n=1 Tax=Clostridiisalibacter paucivorans TaxID=408753 RepID=UPI000A022816|nr:aspartyl-phosphate phosphatase Spo0E family protein [Clostridiisalibacter paucivorans]
MTLMDKIDELRDKLNKSIECEDNFEELYELSKRLDKLIVSYYANKNNKMSS